MRKYTLREMTEEKARRILGDLLAALEEIEESDMTTLELSVLHRCSINPPAYFQGAEHQINNAAYQRKND